MAFEFEVRRGLGSGFGSNGNPKPLLSSQGVLVVVDFYTQSVLDGRGYNVRAGTISVPVVGDILITDTAAEMCADAAANTTIMPMSANINFNLASATLFEAAGKSVATASTAGTAFVPLPLKSSGSAAVSTARVQAAGAVTVTAELATTTPRHFSWGHPIAAGAWPTIYDWNPAAPPVLVGPRCFYIQIGADTTGPSYFASFDYLEFQTAMIDP